MTRKPTTGKTLKSLLQACLAASFAVLGCTPQVPDAVNSAFDFERDAFTFANFDDSVSGAQMSPALAARMFGDASVCRSGAGLTCVPTDAAAAWIDEMNQTLHFGHSEGLAVLAQLMSMGRVASADFGGDTAAALQLNTPGLRAELAYWSATQKMLAVHAFDKKLQASEVIAFLAKSLPDTSERWRLLIAQKDESGFHAGHAVVPFGYFKGTEPGQYFLRIYDSNFPAEERRIELNVRDNSWRYEGSPNPEFPRLYEGTTQNGNLLYFSPVTPRLGQLTPPFVEGFTVSAANGTLLVQGEGDGTLVGFKDGQLVEAGGTLLPGASDCFCKAPSGITNVMIKGSAPMTISVSADAGAVYATSPTVSAKVEGSSGAGAITVDPTAKTVSFNSIGDGGTTISTTTKNADGSQTTVTVTVDAKTNGVTIDASDPNNVKVTADVTTGTTNIAVITTTTTSEGVSSTTVAQGTTSGGNDAAFTINTMTGATEVSTSVNYATCKNGKKDPMETDVDCGGFCNLQDEKFGDGRCAIPKRCGASNDCAAPGYANAGDCFQGASADQSCRDGRLNTRETSTDCGGYCDCPVGGSCASPNRCQTGLKCVGADAGLTCSAQKLHTLNYVGLGGYGASAIYATDDEASPVYRGTAFATSPTWQFEAVGRFVFRNPSSDNYTCTFDTGGSGDWTYTPTGTPTAQTNTVRCTARKFDVKYKALGACAGGDREVTPRDAGVRVWEQILDWTLPTVTVSSTNPAVRTLVGWNPTIGLLDSSSRPNQTNGVWEGLEFVPGQTYDGGSAYAFSVSAATVVQTRYQYNTIDQTRIAALQMPAPSRYRSECVLVGANAGPMPMATEVVASMTCTCERLEPPDAGTDAGTDAGVDAGIDAGPPDAGPPDAGTVDAGSGPACTLDSDCTSSDCYCGDNSGNCTGNSGHCGAGRFLARTPTADGVTPSGTFTVPASCPQLHVSAWGAAGGPGAQQVFMGPGLANAGGAGGFVGGVLNVTAGQKFVVWVGAAGDTATSTTPGVGIGSWVGTAANGGGGDGMFNASSGGSGGGLTSLKYTQANDVLVWASSVPGGGGGGTTQPADPAGGAGAGGNSTSAGESAPQFSTSGGGGAGFDGGLAGVNGAPGSGGTFGAVPSGLAAEVGDVSGNPGGTALHDFQDVATCSQAGKAVGVGTSGNGCVVLRCLP